MNNLYNINGLKNYMIKRLGSDIICNSIRNPNKNDDIIINKNILLDYFTDNKIKEHAKKENWGSEIPLKKFIDFLVDHANGIGTRSKYHEYMEFHPSLFGLSVDRGIPNYDDIVSLELRNKIKYKRDEYIPCFWLVHKIRNHIFLKNFLDFTQPEFQKVLSDNDDRIYDIVFDKLGIIIEVQEDASHHFNSKNDELKESLAICRDNYIMYFKIKSYKENHIKYLDEFWNILYDHILASIFRESTIRKKYVIYRFKEKCLQEKNKCELEKKGYKSNETKYKSISNRINMLSNILSTNEL
jgi:hypothetical protein